MSPSCRRGARGLCFAPASCPPAPRGLPAPLPPWRPSVPPPSGALTLAGAAGKPRQHKQHFTAAVNH